MPSEMIETPTHIIVTIACLSDNYAFLLYDKATDRVALIDVPEAAPITAELSQRGWHLDQIWLTHHHPDHVQGLSEVLSDYPAPVYGAEADAPRLPPLDVALNEGDVFRLGETEVSMLDMSGHTLGHVAFYTPSANAAFTGDSLMALGCGRLFEGTPAQMHESLLKTADWPDEILICSGHEYSTGNAAFAVDVDPHNAALQTRAREINAARAEEKFTVPSLLLVERATNPFLRADDAGVRAHLNMADASDVDVFAELRRRKDNF
jgi:hydroxyacylglutathione hydrolase